VGTTDRPPAPRALQGGTLRIGGIDYSYNRPIVSLLRLVERRYWDVIPSYKRALLKSAMYSREWYWFCGQPDKLTGDNG
jgi:hypothetical protein